MADTNRLVNRNEWAAYMKTAESVYSIIGEGFTALTENKNAKEYSRQYVDEEFEESDVVGYAPSKSYSFDRHTNTPVHERIAKVHDGELTGADTLVDIVVIDLFDPGESDGTYVARKRTWAS